MVRIAGDWDRMQPCVVNDARVIAFLVCGR